MTNPYRAMCSELVDSLHKHTSMWEGHEIDLVTRARALLDQPEPKESKPVVDYSRVTEIATEAQIRSAAQYLVKKQNCDGDLIPAIEYAIARWGCPTPQPEPEAPTDEEIMELMPQHMRLALAAAARALAGFDRANVKAAGAIRIILNRHAVDHARVVLDKWGH